MKLKLFVLIIIFMPCVFMLIACTPKEPPPTHVGELEWSIDEEKHWHECNQPNCLEVFDEQEHLWNTGVQTTNPTCDTEGVLTYTCIICLHTKTESLGLGTEHTPSGEWLSSANKHWQISSCEHKEIVKQGEHNFDENNICKVCKYEPYTTGLVFQALSDESSENYEYAVSDFENNEAKEIIVPSTYNGKPVSKILENSLSNQKYVDKITIGKNVRVIEAFAMASCDTLNDVVFQENSKLDTIEKFAFFDSTYLENIILPDSLKTLKQGAFSFTRIKSINIPKNVTTIEGYFLFRACHELTTIAVDGANTKYKSDGNCLIETNKNLVVAGCVASSIPNYITEIGQGAFACIGENIEITIPASVKKIGDSAFFGCFYKKINFESNSSLTYIDDYAFSDCMGITEIIIPASVNHIGKFAFYVQYANVNYATLKKIQFEQTNGWYITEQKDGMSGTTIDVSDASQNGITMISIYDDCEYFNYYIKRK